MRMWPTVRQVQRCYKTKQKQKAQMRGKTQTILSALTTSAKTTIIYYV